jgi:hypothetical protein
MVFIPLTFGASGFNGRQGAPFLPLRYHPLVVTNYSMLRWTNRSNGRKELKNEQRGMQFAVAIVLGTVGKLTIGSSGLAACQPLTVLEPFQSQGCSDCPPANANVMAVSERPTFLALSFGVTYCDSLGWKDTFASPQYRLVGGTRLAHSGIRKSTRP